MSAIGTNRTSACALHMSAFDPKRTWPMTAQRPRSHEVETTTCMLMAPAVTPAVTTPTPTTTVQASPAVTPAASPPLHVRQIAEVGGGSRRKREDWCRLGRSGPAGKN